MKIRQSLIAYTVVAMAVLVVALTLFSSFLSSHYYLMGVDAIIRNNFSDIARYLDKPSPDRRAVAESMGLIIAPSWEALPEGIRTHFEPPGLDGRIQRHIIQPTLLLQPKSALYLQRITDLRGSDWYLAKDIKDFASYCGCPDDLMEIDFFIAISAGLAVLFSLTLLLFLMVLLKPFEAFKRWSANVVSSDDAGEHAQFRFVELDALAGMIERNIATVKQTLASEKAFLQYSSHEIRTPLTVFRNNIEMLKLWDELPVDKRDNIVARLERSAQSMTRVTDTLLWLTRSSLAHLSPQPTELAPLLLQVVEENRHLLRGKAVEVAIHTDNTRIQSYPDVLQIVLANLVRNTFQHSDSGAIQIRQQGTTVALTNPVETDVGEDRGSTSGFGLGLKLVERLLAMTDWQLTIKETSSQRTTWLHL